MVDPVKPPPANNPYRDALWSAYEELGKLKEEERKIAVRKSQLQQTVNALSPLVFPQDVDIASLSLPDALRLVLQSSGRPLTAVEFKSKLEDIGFDLAKYNDPMANILTAMRRMVEAEEMRWIEDAPRKTVEATPELKHAFPEPPLSFGEYVASQLASEADKGGSK
jgi:hypothetical protein